jgi:hypothetical protein
MAAKDIAINAAAAGSNHALHFSLAIKVFPPHTRRRLLTLSLLPQIKGRKHGLARCIKKTHL